MTSKNGRQSGGKHCNKTGSRNDPRTFERFGFDTLGLAEIVSFTVPANLRSRRVMERIGMTHSPDDDFDHPALPEGTRCGVTFCTESRDASCNLTPRSGHDHERNALH